MIKVKRIVLETDDPQAMEERINAVVSNKKVLGIGVYLGSPVYVPIGDESEGVNKLERRRHVEVFIFIEES